MRPIPLLALLLAATPAFAHSDPDDLVMTTASVLRDWCQHESEAHLIAQGHTPANWTASHIEKLNTLIVDGQWRIDGETVDVECRVARGARAEFASMKLLPR